MSLLKNRNFKAAVILSVLLLVLFAVPTAVVKAADCPKGEYCVLAPLPGLDDSIDQKNILGTYLPYMFNLLIGLSAVAATVMIVLGGFQYMTTDAFYGKQAGKERIKNAVIGLLIILSAWIILYTVNPDLLTINLDIKSSAAGAPNQTAETIIGTASEPGVAMTQEQITASNSVREELKSKNIDVYRDPCTEGQTTGCVNLNGITASTITGLESVKEACSGCSIVITGGTEGGHSKTGDHPKGTAVDMKNTDPNLRGYILLNGTGPVETAIGPQYTVNVNGHTILFTDEGATAPGSTGEHWHVVVVK